MVGREGEEIFILDIEKSYGILWPQWKRQLNGKALRGVRPPQGQESLIVFSEIV